MSGTGAKLRPYSAVTRHIPTNVLISREIHIQCRCLKSESSVKIIRAESFSSAIRVQHVTDKNKLRETGGDNGLVRASTENVNTSMRCFYVENMS